MTTLALDSSCMFCGRPARRRPASSDVPAHDFDCVRCGRYRVGETAELRMRGAGVNRYEALLPKIMMANQEGFRLALPSCFQVPLGEERAIAIAVHAERFVEQSRRGPLAAVGRMSPAAHAADVAPHGSSPTASVR